MRHKKLIILTVVFIEIILSSCATSPAYESVAAPAATSAPDPVTDPLQIQESTILILVQSGASFNEMELGHGIGTLVEHQGETYLVTHNHWGEVLDKDLATVEFRDAQNSLILPMYASAFKDLIVYQDPGTLVLRAVPALLERVNPTRIGSTAEMKVGEIVQVAYRRKPERSSVTVLEGKVVQFSDFEGQPIIEIHSQAGQGLQKGDSGGGVWYNGGLIGNTWAILVAKNVDTASQVGQPGSSSSEESYTAILPDWRE